MPWTLELAMLSPLTGLHCKATFFKGLHSAHHGRRAFNSDPLPPPLPPSPAQRPESVRHYERLVLGVPLRSSNPTLRLSCSYTKHVDCGALLCRWCLLVACSGYPTYYPAINNTKHHLIPSYTVYAGASTAAPSNINLT